MNQTKFNLKPKENIVFIEDKIEFKLKNKSDEFVHIKIIISKLKMREWKMNAQELIDIPEEELKKLDENRKEKIKKGERNEENLSL